MRGDQVKLPFVGTVRKNVWKPKDTKGSKRQAPPRNLAVKERVKK